MPKNSFLKAVFSGPKFSLAPIEKTNKGTTRLGQVIPVYKTMLNGREKIELDLGHLVRFAPTSVPVMEGYEVNFDAFCVPVSAIGYAQRMERDVMDFHNLALNDGEDINPFCKTLDFMKDHLKIGDEVASVGDLFRLGLLGDYLNMPSFKNYRTFVRKWIAQSGLFEGGLYNKYSDDDETPADSAYADIFDFVARVFLNTDYLAGTDVIMTLDGTGNNIGYRNYIGNVPFPVDPTALDEWVNATFSNISLGQTSAIYACTDFLDNSNGAADYFFAGAVSLVQYIFQKYPLVASYYGWSSASNPTSLLNHLYVMRESGDLNLNYLDKLYEYYKVDSQSIFDEYFNYIFGLCLYNEDLTLYGDGVNTLWVGSNYLPDITELPLDFTYFGAYWKIISDWYINTNIDGDPNDFFVNRAGAILREDDDPSFFLDLKPFNRRWANDPFTSSVPSSKVTNVLIPTDGTIPDLREANAFQKLVDILRNTGNRLRDVMYGIRGYRPSADATDMSVPVGTLHSFVGMQSVLQTSATSKDSPLASYAGIGTDSSRGDFKRILKVVNNNEATPVVVMVLMSITQKASYMQGLPRYFSKRSSIYDFAIPQLANIGEQEILNSEIFCDYNNGVQMPNFATSIFGFNRRYYDWFFEDNEVHANMRDSEDMWHGARIFTDLPALNSEFIEINSEADDLQRVFANLSPVAQPIYYNVYFGGSKVVALPRYIQYDL